MAATEKKIEKIEARAQDWFLLQQERSLSQTETEAFNHWLQSDPQHAIAYRQLEAIWQGLGEVSVEEFSEQNGVWQRFSMWLSGARQQQASVWGLTPSMGALASLGAVILVTTLWLSGNFGQSLNTQHYQHGVAEVETHLLSDQTLVTLGAESELVVSMSDGQRSAQLLKGQAFFSVAKDAQRPFYVQAGGTQVKVVGTRFEVHRTQSLVRVSVEEGQVQVAPSSETDGVHSIDTDDSPMLTAGQRIVSRSGSLSDIESIAVEEVSPWRSGRLVYRDARLSEVVFDVNRYRNTKIVLGSDALKTMKVTTSFSVEQADSIVSLLENSLPIVAHRETENRILILPKSNFL